MLFCYYIQKAWMLELFLCTVVMSVWLHITSWGLLKVYKIWLWGVLLKFVDTLQFLSLKLYGNVGHSMKTYMHFCTHLKCNSRNKENVYGKMKQNIYVQYFCSVVVCFLLGNSPASEFYMPTFRNTLSVPSSQVGRYEEWLVRECWGIYTGKVLAWK
jgi:hypothetical protein